MYEITTIPFLKNIWNKEIIMSYRENTNDKGVIESIMRYHEYKSKWFTYSDGDVFVDLGAHIGGWTILMAILNPTFKVYAFEPIPENLELLKRNIENNKLKNIFPLQLAVSNSSVGKERIYYTDDSTRFGAIHKFVGSMLGGTGRTIDVQKISVDEIFKNNNIKRCRVVKSDCEGAEVKGFRTASPETLQKIDYIIGEFHSLDGVDINTFFSWFKPYFVNESYIVQRGEKQPFDLQRFLFRNVNAEEIRLLRDEE